MSSSLPQRQGLNASRARHLATVPRYYKAWRSPEAIETSRFSLYLQVPEEGFRIQVSGELSLSMTNAGC